MVDASKLRFSGEAAKTETKENSFKNQKEQLNDISKVIFYGSGCEDGDKRNQFYKFRKIRKKVDRHIKTEILKKS
jgi:hypothetical protein